MLPDGLLPEYKYDRYATLREAQLSTPPANRPPCRLSSKCPLQSLLSASLLSISRYFVFCRSKKNRLPNGYYPPGMFHGADRHPTKSNSGIPALPHSLYSISFHPKLTDIYPYFHLYGLHWQIIPDRDVPDQNPPPCHPPHDR